MKVRLLRDARIIHKAGEIIDVSPAEFNFLVSVGSAVEVAVKMPDKMETAEKIEKADITKKPEKATEKKSKKK